MMRRAPLSLAAKASMFRPIFDFLMTAQPGKTANWAREAAILHKANVHTPDCWAHLNVAQKQAIVADGLPQSVADLLTEATSAVSSTIKHKKVLVAFGSQTGTAESYARMLSIFATSHGYVPIVAALNDVPKILEENKASKAIEAMLIVTSTYGTGEFPTNSDQFAKQLLSGKLNESVRGIKYSIMGLGNSANEHFNNAAKKIDKALKDAGASSFIRTQLSCELVPNGHDNIFRGWKRNIWATLGNANAVAGVAGGITTLPSSYNVATVHQPEKLVARPHYFNGHVQGNVPLTARGYSPESRLLTFTVPIRTQTDELGGRKAKLNDQIQIHPRNSKAAAERAAKLLGVSLADCVEITPVPGAPQNYYDGRKVTMETVLREIVDLSAAPSRTLLDTIASACPSEAERAKLDDLANDLSANSAYDQLLAKGFTIIDLLEMCPSIKLTTAQLLTVAPQIAPRTYSVAKDNTEWLPEEFEICYNVPTKANHKGLCTQMMADLEVGDDFLMKFLPDVTTIPQNKNPLLIVALGSGIGTARSLLHRRKIAKSRGEEVGKICLFYGFRELGKDQLFEKELSEFVAEGLLDVRYVPSNDGSGKYVTPMDKLDRSIVDFLGAKGEFSYCGLGGSVPLKVESALQKNGVDTAALRATGRYHEEYFSADQDVENLLKVHGTGAVDASTLLGRMGATDMFCFQCEQTFGGKGCHKVGVCGKTPRVAALQDLTVHAAKIIGFYANALRGLGEPVADEVNRFTLYALFTTLTNVNFDETRFVDILGQASAHVIKLKDQYVAACGRKGVAEPEKPFGVHLPVPLTTDCDKLVELGRQVGVLRRFSDPATQSGAAVSEMLIYGLKGVAAYTDHALMNGKEDATIYEYMHRALAFMAGPDSLDLAKALPLALEAGKANVASMSLLYNSNKTLGVPTPTKVSVKPVAGKAILVSGHDLIMLKGLLEKTDRLGINVYTHGEMLPAHSYPHLKEHKSLVGHYGGAWMRQSVEFPEFPGAILMTTNCLTEPKESYGGRLFTAGAVGWKNVPHIGNTMADIDYAALLDAAMAAPGFAATDKEFAYADPAGQKRPDHLTVGFGHETIQSVAPQLLDAIKSGEVTRFFLVGGCDGFEGARSYYTELVQNLPKTAVVLTLGCGKYRFNHLDRGTIGNTGIPRILDMGQCNDTYSAVMVANTLASALNCQVGDLPLNIVLSWFEQKAVAVLLSCLHLGLKGVHVGPTLPAFITPDVLDVLVNQYGVRPLGDAAEDAKRMCAGN